MCDMMVFLLILTQTTQRTLGYSYTGVHRKKLSIPFSSPAFHLRNSVFETLGEKPTGPRAAPLCWGAALEPAGFSPGVSKTELRR
jgi:hypothetical protein